MIVTTFSKEAMVDYFVYVELVEQWIAVLTKSVSISRKSLGN